MSTELTTTNPGIPMLLEGATFDPSDIVLPTLSIRQNTFKNEAYKKFRGGDLILRPDMKVVGNETDGFQIIPLSVEKIVKVLQLVSASESRLMGWEQVDKDKPQEWSEGGKNYRRDLCYIIYFLDAKQAEAQAKAKEADPDDFAMPIRAVFSRRSLYAAKIINTHFERCRMFNAPTWSKVFNLKSGETSNDKGNWYVFKVEPILEAGKNKKVPAAVLPLAEFWAKTLATSKASFKHVAEEDDVVDVPVVTANESDVPF